VDLPAIDTVMMLRPTESKILFLQQLGRGLRRHADKRHLLVLDFIGNHKGFLNKPQALFDCGSRYQDLAAFGRRVRDGQLKPARMLRQL
jgi:superfamily II DNA or RNA helicase